MDNEVWKDIPGYEGRYQVSNYGRVRSVERYSRKYVPSRIIKPIKGTNCYSIKRDSTGKQSSYTINRLMYVSFVGNIPEGYQVLTKDPTMPVSLDNIIVVKRGTTKLVSEEVEPGKFASFRGSKVYNARKEYKIIHTSKGVRRSPIYYLTVKCHTCGRLFEMRYVSRKTKTNLAQCQDCSRSECIKYANEYRENNKEVIYYNSLKYKSGDYVGGCKIVNYFNGDELPYEIECKYCGKHFRSKYSIMSRRKDLNCGCQPTYKYDYLDLDCSSKLYKKWGSIKQRCSPVNKQNADRYYNKKTAFNGVGIRVCKLWDNSYEEFYRWALENGYDESKSCSIDRIYSDGDYAPFNCQFLSLKDNAIKSNTFDTLSNKEYALRKIIYNRRKKNWIKQMVKQGYKEEDLI